MSVNPESLTLAEFLAWEERQPAKHEFRAGSVFATAGATDDHNQIVANLVALIRPALRGGSCRVYANDMMLITDYPGSRYPDILVTCDPRDAKDRRKKRYPKLIIEVLSDATAAIDTGDKLDEYQTIETLEEYVLIDSRRPSVRLYRRVGLDLQTGPAIISGSVFLGSIERDLPFVEIYEDVSWVQVDTMTR